jgi:hypothetical protein
MAVKWKNMLLRFLIIRFLICNRCIRQKRYYLIILRYYEESIFANQLKKVI